MTDPEQTTTARGELPPRRLVVMDVDSTFITAEVIELIAERAGTRELVAAVTEAAMRGELDFAQSLRERVATLRGVPESVLTEIADEVEVSPGVPELVAFLAERDWPLALVSGGFIEVVAVLARRWHVAHARANVLEVDDAGLLTGRVTGPIIDRAAKEAALREFAALEGVAMRDTVAIGDGANDLDMLAAAGLGIAFRAKPVVAAAADHAVHDSLVEVVELLS
ncbi:phosphoserine phosphatase [Salana multivorans]|uniref:phosphoserine phosphatase n=1 Tax=Salana multivorans TaxID=120377 RepID=A0A3N2D105_9MICO|nr:phosphoserine phosphatase SerB [Salana multivorans]ROR93338.1 phosphoserine phosphatase [Salana multivorans]